MRTSGRRAQKSLLIALAVTSLLSGSSFAAADATRDELLNLQQQLLAALTKPDSAAAAKLMSDKLVFVRAVGIAVDKQQQLARMMANRPDVATAINTTLQLYRDTALLTGEIQYRSAVAAVSGPSAAVDKPNRYEVSTLWAREKGHWVVTFWQATPIVEAAH